MRECLWGATPAGSETHEQVCNAHRRRRRSRRAAGARTERRVEPRGRRTYELGLGFCAGPRGATRPPVGEAELRHLQRGHRQRWEIAWALAHLGYRPHMRQLLRVGRHCGWRVGLHSGLNHRRRRLLAAGSDGGKLVARPCQHRIHIRWNDRRASRWCRDVPARPYSTPRRCCGRVLFLCAYLKWKPTSGILLAVTC